MAEVEEKYSKQFGFKLIKDPGVTGNLEVFVWNTANPSKREAVH